MNHLFQTSKSPKSNVRVLLSIVMILIRFGFSVVLGRESRSGFVFFLINQSFLNLVFESDIDEIGCFCGLSNYRGYRNPISIF